MGHLTRWHEKLLCTNCGRVTQHEIEEDGQWRVYTCLECAAQYVEQARRRHHKLHPEKPGD